MILDRIENARTYLGLSDELDKALTALMQMDFSAPMPERTEISDRTFCLYSERTLLPRRSKFEFHRKFIDIHVPINTTEQIAICSANDAPPGLSFDISNDCALFDGRETCIAAVPAGWFCICFPQDAHEPLIGDARTVIRKLVFKVAACAG